MRVADMLMTLPSIIAAVALASLLGQNIYNIVLAIAVTGWMHFAHFNRIPTFKYCPWFYNHALKGSL